MPTRSLTSFAVCLLAACLFAACKGEDASGAIEGTWAWQGDGGCAASGERISIAAGQITWISGEAKQLGTSTVTIQTGFDQVDRMRRWLSLEYTRGAQQIEERFQVTDRLGSPVFQLETRRVDNAFEEDFPHQGDRLVPCEH